MWSRGRRTYPYFRRKPLDRMHLTLDFLVRSTGQRPMGRLAHPARTGTMVDVQTVTSLADLAERARSPCSASGRVPAARAAVVARWSA